MITLRELRTISLEFRRVSSNFLNCDDDTADVALIRFYSYLTRPCFKNCRVLHHFNKMAIAPM